MGEGPLRRIKEKGRERVKDRKKRKRKKKRKKRKRKEEAERKSRDEFNIFFYLTDRLRLTLSLLLNVTDCLDPLPEWIRTYFFVYGVISCGFETSSSSSSLDSFSLLTLFTPTGIYCVSPAIYTTCHLSYCLLSFAHPLVSSQILPHAYYISHAHLVQIPRRSDPTGC